MATPTSEADELLALLNDEGQTSDPEPGYMDAKTPMEDRIFPDEPVKSAPPKRVNLSTRKDIRGKVAMLLTVPGSMWAGRDPHCGGAFLEAIPDQVGEVINDQGELEEATSPGIATALTDIICESPDVVNWFTSSGKYMKWLTLAMAVQPVLATAFQHHVTHSLASTEETSDDWSRYSTQR